MSRNCRNKTCSIDDVQVTGDCLTGRAGLNFFVRYLRGIDLYPHLERLFGSMRKHPKGASIQELFKQILCFLFDGTSRHLAHFDVLATDPGYAATIETPPTALVSSDTVRRFYRAFPGQEYSCFAGCCSNFSSGGSGRPSRRSSCWAWTQWSWTTTTHPNGTASSRPTKKSLVLRRCK